MFTMLVNYTTQSERGEICDKREIHTKKRQWLFSVRSLMFAFCCCTRSWALSMHRENELKMSDISGRTLFYDIYIVYACALENLIFRSQLRHPMKSSTMQCTFLTLCNVNIFSVVGRGKEPKKHWNWNIWKSHPKKNERRDMWRSLGCVMCLVLLVSFRFLYECSIFITSLGRWEMSCQHFRPLFSPLHMHASLTSRERVRVSLDRNVIFVNLLTTTSTKDYL